MNVLAMLASWLASQTTQQGKDAMDELVYFKEEFRSRSLSLSENKQTKNNSALSSHLKMSRKTNTDADFFAFV